MNGIVKVQKWVQRPVQSSGSCGQFIKDETREAELLWKVTLETQWQFLRNSGPGSDLSKTTKTCMKEELKEEKMGL